MLSVNIIALYKKTKLCKPGVGKLFVRRATFEKNVAAEGRTLSLQNRKIYYLCKKIHIHIKRSFCISHSGTLGRRAPPRLRTPASNAQN